ncbi:MAG TPA: SsrA-binding protein SmpB [Gammaproteobacteria bacterium]|nr:SsrA-binding protein SmpB [Gammaproteobacteria bacterium]
MSQQDKKKNPGKIIALNKKAKHDFFIDERLEAGLVLEGWEVRSLRAGKAQIRDAYILLKDGEAYLFGALITPLPTASTHINPDPKRTRKILLHRKEINRLIGEVERKGHAVIATALYWKNGRAKLEIGIARGKKAHDKRATIKERDWNREQQRILKHG